MAHLPRAKGQQPGVCAEEALPNFLDKLGQLGVHLAAVINLPRADEGEVTEGHNSPKCSQSIDAWSLWEQVQ